MSFKIFVQQMATKKILEKMKQDENLRSFEGSSGPLSDDLEDSDDDDDGLSQVGVRTGSSSSS